MASSSALYFFSPETKQALRKFRLGTSRASKPQAVIYQGDCFEMPIHDLLLTAGLFEMTDEIDKSTGEIRQSEDTEVYSDLASIAEELPEHAPRFVLLSYPYELDDGRMSVPYVMIYYMPVHCNADVRMRYASAKELIRGEAAVGRVFDISESEEILEIEEQLRNHES